MPRQRNLWGNLPRVVYWTIGAATALAGAIVARLFAEHLPEHRVPIWLAGVSVIFLGVAVLSLGTRSRLDGDESNHQ